MKGERITSNQQLALWVAGESVHRFVEGTEGGECTPDFSCCKPELLADEATRRAFAAAGDSERLGFLSNFLGAAIRLATPEMNVHIAGRDPEQQS